MEKDQREQIIQGLKDASTWSFRRACDKAIKYLQSQDLEGVREAALEEAIAVIESKITNDAREMARNGMARDILAAIRIKLNPPPPSKASPTKVSPIKISGE